MPDINLNGIHKQYGKRQQSPLNSEPEPLLVLQNLQLQVRDGERLVLLGASGCGKTTLLRIIAGLERPDSGQVYFGEKEVTKTAAVKRQLGMVFQSLALYPHLTVEQHLRVPSLGWRRRSRETQEWRDSLLNAVELDQYRRHKPGELSGGQQQRFALARALVRKPQVLLLDEPLGHLDTHLRQRLRAQIRTIVEQHKLTTILVTHDQRDAMDFADRIAVMDCGVIMQIGRPQEIVDSPANQMVRDLIGW